VATGGTEHLHNHLETTYANGRRITDGKTYQVSFRAKWLAGNNRLNTRLYFNRVAKTTVLPMPSNMAPRRAQLDVYRPFGSDFAAFGHSPVVPQPNQAVTVSASASDPPDSSRDRLVVGQRGVWQQAPMLPVSAASTPGYTNYAALIPGQATGGLVQFYVQAPTTSGIHHFPPGT